METKTCSTCKTEKPVTEFYKSKARGYQTYCKSCAKERRTQWGRDNKQKVRGYKLQYQYGLSHEMYEAMLLAQEGRCAICSEEFTGTPNIDHDHVTGAVRGLLCTGCNIFVGHIETRMLDRALEYIKRGSSVRG